MSMIGDIRIARVVTAIDFHESSRAAALWAMQHFTPDAEHQLLHVVEVPALPQPLRALASGWEQRRLSARASAQRGLDALASAGSAARVSAHIREGKPADEVVDLAEKELADLIVVGEQGPTRGVAALLGSTAERVLHASSIPVLVARKLDDSPPRRLLVAIDPSEISGVVLAWTRALLQRFDASVTVLTVVDRRTLADELSWPPVAGDLQTLVDDATATMQGWQDGVIRDAGLPRSRVQARLLVGDPSYEIIAEAAREQADIILIGSKGGDIARTPLIGRVVNKVVRSAPCSVLVVVPPREPIEQASPTSRDPGSEP